ncbi:MAG: O-antigen ligase family protein [Phycisphaerae bacterium]|nr:O-antigen ligase family protein [Saprospiraceae bacterium]
MRVNILKPISTPSGLAFWSANLLIVSMVLSPFLLSVSMWFLVFAAWWHTAQTLQASLRLPQTWWEVLKVSFVRFFQRRELAVLTLLLLAPALSFFWSDDKAYWLRLVQTRLPFLVLPWAFANLPTLSEKQWKSVLYLLVWFMAGMCIAVGINFLLHFDTIIEGLGRGNPVPVPRSHVRFSLVLATAIISGGWLWQQGFWLWRPWERKALAAGVVFLFVFIHVLSVRSGLFSLYAALFFALIRYVWLSKKWLAGFAALSVLVGGLWIASETVPSLKMRIAYMKYDWERFNTHDDGHLYSDAVRWISLQSGWRLWQQNPILGTGAGDLLSETKRITAALFPSYSQETRLPHNQFLFIMASTGLFGLIISLMAFFWLVYAGRKNSLFLTFQVMAFASFLIECTIENAIGVAWFLFYSLWFLSCTQKNHSASIS